MRRPYKRGSIAALVLLAIFGVPAASLPARAHAQQPALEGEQAVEAGRKALRDSNRYPWYDAQTDGLRRIDAPPDKSAENLNRQSQWQTKPFVPRARTPWAWPSGLTTFFYAMSIIVGLVVFGLLLWLLIYAFMKREVGIESAGGSADMGDERGDADRIENLPFQVKRPQSDLRGEAERNYREGNYREAIVYLYSYLLLQLDRRQVIRLTKGKTNRQYLRETRARPELVPIFETTMIAFEDVFFGDHPLSQREFETCWNRLDEFHRLLDQSQQAAA